MAGLDHDGRFVQSEQGVVDAAWVEKVLAVANTIAPHKIDVLPDLDEAIAILVDRFPDKDWETVDENWEEDEEVLMEMNERLRKGESHFGELAARALTPVEFTIGE